MATFMSVHSAQHGEDTTEAESRILQEVECAKQPQAPENDAKRVPGYAAKTLKY